MKRMELDSEALNGSPPSSRTDGAEAPARVLAMAADLLVEIGWARGCFARNALGDPVPETSADVFSLCAVGAIGRAAHELLAGEGPALVRMGKHCVLAVEHVLWKREAADEALEVYNDKWAASAEEVRGLLLEASRLDHGHMVREGMLPAW